MSEIEVRSGSPGELGVDLLAVPLTKPPLLTDALVAADGWLGGVVGRTLEQGLFQGRADETTFLPAPEGRPHVLLVGTGEVAELGPKELRAAGGVAARFARSHRIRSLALAVPPEAATPVVVQAASEGLVLGDWSFDELRRPDEDRGTPPGLRALWIQEPGPETGEAARTGRIIAEAQNASRALVTLPGNIATPEYLAGKAEELSNRGVRVQAWGPDKLRQEGFGALLAVSKGSAVEPRFIILEHTGDGGTPVVLVGKGVTFDSGGISLKPAKGMEDMKYDMAGSAAVLGTLEAVAALSSPQRVIGLIAATENLPSGTALKPGDVIRGVSGRSIEVVNTDAEGRLILSDALSYAARLGPAAVVNVATLTGACVVALGSQAAGLMTNDDDLARALDAAGGRSDERLWRLPLWDEYRRQLDSEIADIKNAGGREAGAITAGRFLMEFVEDVAWAHLDIAGTAWADKEKASQPKGATGFGVRLLTDWVHVGRA